MTLVLANIFGFGNPWDIAIIAGVVVLLFGGSKVAGFGKNLGEGMKEFKKAVKEGQEEGPASVSTVPEPPASVEKTAEPVATAPVAAQNAKEQ